MILKPLYDVRRRQIYHIYNGANGDENLFREAKNYPFFLKKYYHHIHTVVETFAFCLLSNHFHAMVRIRTKSETTKLVPEEILQRYGSHEKFVSKQFSNFFSSYSQAFNKVYQRHGSLFQPSLKRKVVDSDEYLTALIICIHNNPAKHGFQEKSWNWPYSSIHQFIDGGKKSPTFEPVSATVIGCTKEKVVGWFGNQLELQKAHARINDSTDLSSLYTSEVPG